MKHKSYTNNMPEAQKTALSASFKPLQTLVFDGANSAVKVTKHGTNCETILEALADPTSKLSILREITNIFDTAITHSSALEPAIATDSILPAIREKLLKTSVSADELTKDLPEAQKISEAAQFLKVYAKLDRKTELSAASLDLVMSDPQLLRLVQHGIVQSDKEVQQIAKSLASKSDRTSVKTF